MRRGGHVPALVLRHLSVGLLKLHSLIVSEVSARWSQTTMSDCYVEKRNGVYRVAGSRVSFDSIVYALLSCQSAEAIAQAFPR